MADFVTLKGIRCSVCECITCGVPYAVSEAVFNQHVAEGGYHTCPNGHHQGWDKGGCERERLRRERDRLKQDAARLQDEISTQRRRAEDAEEKIVAAKRRSAAGVCPCCNRTFSALARHMKTKHPTVISIDSKKSA